MREIVFCALVALTVAACCQKPAQPKQAAKKVETIDPYLIYTMGFSRGRLYGFTNPAADLDSALKAVEQNWQSQTNLIFYANP